MKKFLSISLLMASPLLADNCCNFAECMPLQNPTCYPYAVNPPLTSPACCTFGAEIDFLYWRPYLEDNAFAQVITVGGTATASTNFSIKEKNFDNNWHAGFRVGVGAGLPCNEWRVSLRWTHFLDHSKGLVSAAGTNINTGISGGTASLQFTQLPYLTDAGFLGLSLDAITSSVAQAEWDVQYNTLDLVFERQFYVGHKVTFNPYGGLRAIFLRQTIDASNEISFAFDADPSPLFSTVNTVLDMHSDFKGIGVLAGFSTTWDWLCNFGFYGDFSTSLAYGSSQVKSNGSFTTPTALSTIQFTDTFEWENNDNPLRATLDLAFGLEWRQIMNNNCGLLTIRAGWEQHLLFGQNVFPSISGNSLSLGSRSVQNSQSFTNLTFQGLVLSAAFSF